MNAQLIIDSKSILGEGPVWHDLVGCLFWVDIEGKKINKFDPKIGKTQSRQFDNMPGAMAIVDRSRFLVAFDDGLAIYDWYTNDLSYENNLCRDTTQLRANDGKCDPMGNFWIGTMHLDLEPRAGALYKFDHHFNLSLQVPNRTISNGLAWSSNGSNMYYIDSWHNKVYSYQFHPLTGRISDEKEIITVDTSMGSADGMTIDLDDNLWISHWAGSCVRQWNPRTGKVLQTINVAAPHVTSCAFGGAAMDELYITTARSGLSEEELKKYPLSGGVFKVKPGVVGRPSDFFKISKNESL